MRNAASNDAEHAKAARTLPEGLSSERSGFICRVLRIVSIPVQQGTCGFPGIGLRRCWRRWSPPRVLEIEAAGDVATVAG